MESDQAKKEKLAKITKELTCPICTYILDDPNALHCGHSFCGICIHEWLENSKTCPLCRVKIARQPVHVTTLQELADLMRPTPSTRKRLIRENWVSLFPIENNITFIVDEDEEGIIHRCSQCSWELTEENYCARCNIQYDNDILPIRENSVERESDIDFDHNELESNLEGFVVSDDEVEYDSDTMNNASMSYNGMVSFDSDIESLPSIPHSNQNSQDTIQISDDEDTPIRLGRSESNRKRRIQFISDDDSEEEAITDSERISGSEDYSDDDVEYASNPPRSRTIFETPIISDEMDSDYGYGEEEFSEDPFPRPSRVSRFIDDSASEDDDEYETPSKPPKVDKITENINRARSRMESQTANVQNEDIVQTVDSDSSDSDDDSDAPDYESMALPLKSTAPSASTAAAPAPPQPQTEGQASSSIAMNTPINTNKKKKKKSKKSRKVKSKRDKKKHKAE